MHTVELTYLLGANGAQPALIRNALMDLLFAVREQGSISAAAKALGLSYRHVWGELKRWEQILGRTLIVWDKGQPARLNEFGEKLLWAERQAQARLAPQISALRAELERTFAVAFDNAAHVVSLYASHDDALVALQDHAVASATLHLDVRYSGSLDAISALNEGRCVMAGFHTRQHPVPGSRSERAYKPLLQPGLHKIIGFARRDQGLIVPRGNPLGLRTIADLLRPGVRYVNRALGTGTRVLLDELLEEAGIAAESVSGYTRHEPSHKAVAHAIASGSADAGLGIASAAHRERLDFVPLVEENYFLVCLKSTLDTPAMQALMGVLRGEAWQATLAAMPGYTPTDSGQVLSLQRTLPWWDFAGKPKRRTSRASPRRPGR